MSDAPKPPAGFYPDPDDSTKQKYWDGEQWGTVPPGHYRDPDDSTKTRYWDGKEWEPESIAELPYTPLDPEIINKPSKFVNFGCAGLIVIAIIVIIAAVNSPKTETEYNPNNSVEVIHQCEDLVKNSLKSPSSAIFVDTKAQQNQSRHWTVTGSVDAQNSFGAMIRSDFQCSVQVHTNSVTRRLDYLN